MTTHPVPVPDPLEIVVHEDPALLPSRIPVLASSRYIAFPAFGAVGPRFGIEASISGKYPDPTITAVTERSAFSAPIAGSDQVKPTVFSANEAVDFKSP